MGIWQLYLDRGGGVDNRARIQGAVEQTGTIIIQAPSRGNGRWIEDLSIEPWWGTWRGASRVVFLDNRPALSVVFFDPDCSLVVESEKKIVLTNSEQREDSVLIASWAGNPRLLAGVAPPPERLYICFPGASSSTLFQLPPHFYTPLLHSTIPIPLFNHHIPRHSTHNVWHQGW